MKMRTCIFCGGFGVRHHDVKVGVGDPSEQNGGVAGEGVWEASVDVCGQCNQMLTITKGQGVVVNKLDKPEHELYDSLGILCAYLIGEYKRYYNEDFRTEMWTRDELTKMDKLDVAKARLSEIENKRVEVIVMGNLNRAHKRLILLHK